MFHKQLPGMFKNIFTISLVEESLYILYPQVLPDDYEVPLTDIFLAYYNGIF